jgi:hypothetical protein
MNKIKQIFMAKTKKPVSKKATAAKSKKQNPLKWKLNPLPKAGQYVNSVAISGDGSKVIAGTYFFNYSPAGHSITGEKPFTVGVFAYNQTNALIWKDEFQVSEGVYWVAISRDGGWAAGGGLEIHGQGFISAYNAANGNKVIDYKIPARTNMVALNADGSCLVAGADALYVFTRLGTSWNTVPQRIACIQANDSVISVGISADGSSIVAGTLKGTVMLIKNTGGVLGAPVSWKIPGASVHWIAMAAGGSAFAAGGSGSSLYYFSLPAFQTTKTPAWTGSLTGCNSCRSVALSDDGTLVSAVANKGKAGMVFLFGPTGTLKWSNPTQYSPNSTSIDSAGKYVTVADGFPDGTPGAFQLFDAGGNSLWSYPTTNMSWPMQISANASGIAAGSDDSFVYYFS